MCLFVPNPFSPTITTAELDAEVCHSGQEKEKMRVNGPKLNLGPEEATEDPERPRWSGVDIY